MNNESISADLAASGSRPTCEPPSTPVALLRDLRAWLTFKLEHGPIRHYRSDEDSSGPYNQHPSGFAAVQMPDWDIRQKLQEIEDTLAQAEPDGAAPQGPQK